LLHIKVHFHYSEEEDQVDPKVAGHLPDQEDLIQNEQIIKHTRKPLDQRSRSKYQRPSISLKTFITVSQWLNY